MGCQGSLMGKMSGFHFTLFNRNLLEWRKSSIGFITHYTMNAIFYQLYIMSDSLLVTVCIYFWLFYLVCLIWHTGFSVCVYNCMYVRIMKLYSWCTLNVYFCLSCGQGPPTLMFAEKYIFLLSDRHFTFKYVHVTWGGR